MSISKRKQQQVVDERLDAYRVKYQSTRGFVGDLGRNIINVPGATGMIYVTTFAGHVSEVLNRRMPSPVIGTPILYGIDPDDMPGVLQVLGEWNVYGNSSNPNTANAVAYHKAQHEWPNADTVGVWGEQFMPSLYFPGVGLKVTIYPGNYYTAAGWLEIKTLTTVDLSALSPALAAGECRYAMIVVDATGAITVRVGAIVTGWVNLTYASIPAPTAGDNTICAVKMFYGQSAFRKDGGQNDFTDLRWAGVSYGASVAGMANSSNYLSGDVAMTNADTYYDGPSLSLAAGTWLLTGQVTCGTDASDFTAKLWDGTTVLSSGMSARPVNTFSASIPLSAIVSPGSTTTYKISAACDNAGKSILAAVSHNAAGNTASYLLAIRLA